MVGTRRQTSPRCVLLSYPYFHFHLGFFVSIVHTCYSHKKTKICMYFYVPYFLLADQLSPFLHTALSLRRAAHERPDFVSGGPRRRKGPKRPHERPDFVRGGHRRIKAPKHPHERADAVRRSLPIPPLPARHGTPPGPGVRARGRGSVRQLDGLRHRRRRPDREEGLRVRGGARRHRPLQLGRGGGVRFSHRIRESAGSEHSKLSHSLHGTLTRLLWVASSRPPRRPSRRPRSR